MSKAPMLIGGLVFCIILVIVVVVMTKNGGGDAPPEPEPIPVVYEEDEDEVFVPSAPIDLYEGATWEEAKKSEKSGHPEILTTPGHGPIHHIPVGDSWHLIGPGKAPSQKDCWEFSKRNKINNYAWRKADKSCWAYKDPFLYQGKMHPGSEANHRVGCTIPGRKLSEGCEDISRGDIAIGHRHDSTWLNDAEFDKLRHKKMSLAKCRETVKALNERRIQEGEPEDTVYAVGYRTNKHPTNEYSNTCFAYAKPRTELNRWFGNQADVAHVTACIDPTKKIRNGCV